MLVTDVPPSFENPNNKRSHIHTHIHSYTQTTNYAYSPPDAPTEIYSGRNIALKSVPPIAGRMNSNAAAKKP